MPAPDEQTLASASLPGPGVPGRPRVCFITTEFHGLFKNGGIGTANTSLALTLSESDFDVTVAFADCDEEGPRVKGVKFPELQEKYRESGITLDFVPASSIIAKAFDDPRSASYCVYLYLKQHAFDVVYFNDCGGQGYYSLLAKRVGVFPNAPRMYVVAHGPQEWVLELNSLEYWDRMPVITAYMERRSAALADVLISPSQYLIDWMTSHHWAMPEKVLVVPNIVRLPDSVTPSVRCPKLSTITEIVFFGRLEVRKGIELFCDAIDLLNRSTDLSGVRITFMGKFSHVAGFHSGMYVVERARQWQSSLRVLCTYGQEDALCYLNRAGTLAVIPSYAENSPCVVAECLQLGVPFVATGTGGTVELVDGEDRELCLVEPNPQAMATKLDQILKSGHGPARPATSQAELLVQWLRLSDPEKTADSNPEAEELWSSAEPRPVVTVCLTASSLSSAAQGFIESLLGQSYPNLEIILLDDGGGDTHRRLALASLKSVEPRIPFRILPGTPGDRSAQRNALAAEASGDYLFFVEECNVFLTPACIEALVTAALRTGASIVTAVPLEWQGQSAGVQEGRLSYFPIGGCAEVGGFENCFGRGTLLAARRSFEQLGGFATPCDPEIDDWLFLATCVLAGLYLEVVPEPLFGYRMRHPAGLDRSKVVDNHRRILGAYSAQKIEMLKHVIETVVHVNRAQGERLRGVLESVSGEAREIALRVSASFEPNSEDALRGFVQFCIERHKIQEAFDFAFYNSRPLLTDAIGSAKLSAETLTLDGLRRYRLGLWHEVGLTADVRQRIQWASGFPVQDLVHPCDGVAAYSIAPGITILKASAACPSGAGTVRAVARVEVRGGTSLFLALAASMPGAHMRLSGRGLESESSDAFWWSGWVAATGRDGKLELEVPVLEPTEELLDLHFLGKTGDDDIDPTGNVTWESVSAVISLTGATSASAIEPHETATPIPRHVIDRGVLLTPNPDFPFPVFVPGDPTLLHPLPGRAALARISGAVPSGTKGVRSFVSIERAEAHPVEFAVWVRPSFTPVTNVDEFGAEDAFSGWFCVRDTFRRHSFMVTLRERATEEMDLYLATRVVEFPDVHYCHAVWRELLILQ